MPANITDVSTWTTPVVVPADGDAGLASSVSAAFQALANRTALLRGSHKIHSYMQRTVADPTDANATIASTSSTSYATLSGWSPGTPFVATPAVGDMLIVVATLNVQFTGVGNAGGYLKLVAHDGTTENDIVGAKCHRANNMGNVGFGLVLAGLYTFAGTASHEIRLKGKCGSGSDTLNWFGEAGYFHAWLKAT